MVAPGVYDVPKGHRGSNSEERRAKPSPYIGDSFREVVRESPLFEGGQTVCNYVPDLGQVSEVATHVFKRLWQYVVAFFEI